MQAVIHASGAQPLERVCKEPWRQNLVSTLMNALPTCRLGMGMGEGSPIPAHTHEMKASRAA